MDRNQKATQKPSVSMTHCHGKHEMLSNSQNKLSKQIGRKHCCQEGDPNSSQESESLYSINRQLTQKCLYTPCQENAGTSLRGGKGHRLAWRCSCLQLVLFGCNFPGMEETLSFLSLIPLAQK